MSASLVGSEMCIRDRAPGSRRECSDRQCHRPAPAPPAGPNAAGARASAPVSYTHLTLPTICSV
eukprot:14181853-Alexandrium_andersonii.AAC.1